MKCLHLLIAVIAGTVQSQLRADNVNDVIWFPVDGEQGIVFSAKGERFISSSGSDKKWYRQRRHSNSEEVVYFPPEDVYNDDKDDYFRTSDTLPFHLKKERLILPSDPLKSNQFWAEPLDKNLKYVHSSNQERNFLLTTQVENNVKKLKLSHNQHGQETEPYHRMNYYNLQESNHRPEQYNNENHYSTNEKYVPEYSSFPYTYLPPIYPYKNQKSFEPKKHDKLISSNEQHEAKIFDLPNKSGDFFFPDSYPSDGFYNPSGIQHQDHLHNSFNQNSHKPSADLVLSFSTTVFPKYTSNPGYPDITVAESNSFVFPGETDKRTKQPFPTTTPTTTAIPCERTCQVTPEFNPVCGTDYETYFNIGKLKCARKCGKDVHFYHYGSCGRSRFTVPFNHHKP